MAQRRPALLTPDGPCNDAGKLAAIALGLDRAYRRLPQRRSAEPLTNHSDTEDVLQDAALRALEHCSTLRLEWGRLTPWLNTTTRHLEIDEMRKARREELLLCRDVEQLQAIATPERQAESRLMLNEEQQRMLDAANALSPSFRAVFFMFHRDELSHGEISAKLGISEEASRMRLSRAHEILRKQLGPETGEMLNSLRCRLPPLFFGQNGAATETKRDEKGKLRRVLEAMRFGATASAALLAASLAGVHFEMPRAIAGLHVPDVGFALALSQQPASIESTKVMQIEPILMLPTASGNAGSRPEKTPHEAQQEDAGGKSFRMKRPTQSRIPFLR